MEKVGLSGGHSERNDHFLDREDNPPDGGPRIRKAEARPRGPRAARQSGDRRRGRPRPYRGSTGATMAQWTAAATAVGIPADAYQFCSPDNVSTNYPVFAVLTALLLLITLLLHKLYQQKTSELTSFQYATDTPDVTAVNKPAAVFVCTCDRFIPGNI